jgi:hypothetical protein
MTLFSSEVSTPQLSTFTIDSNVGTSISHLTVTITVPTTTTAVSAVPTEDVNHPGQNAVQSPPSHSNATTIAVASISVALVLCIIGIAICFVLRRRRFRPGHQKGAPSQNVDADTVEKYAGASEYAYSPYQHDAAETKGTLPLLKTLLSKSRRSSRQSGELSRYHDTDAPASPFLNEDVESTHTPLAHAVSLGDARPFSEVVAEAQFEYVDLLPSPERSPPTTATHPAFPPLVIPENTQLGRKQTAGKRVSRRSTRRHSYRALDAGDVSDGDSESMYSQASASTTYSAAPSPQERPASFAHAFPLAAIPGSPATIPEKRDSSATIRPREVSRASSHIPAFSYTASASEEDADADAALEDAQEQEDEDSVLVARLLKSRVRPEQPPARSGSVVSHIERQGSIRPAYRASAGDALGRERVRPLRALRKSHHGAGVGAAGSPVPEMPRSAGERAGF